MIPDFKSPPVSDPGAGETDFPADFLFGAAAAAYQIEGAPFTDGKGPSVWDDFVRRRGRIAGGDRGDTACDHYRLWKADVALMKELGLQAYRGSVSWPRVIPEGKGPVNPRGLDFYSRLTDGLLEAGIRPFLTLFHWDLPLALQKSRGGFLCRDTAAYFGDYTEQVVKVLGDRVKDWITVNEPFEYAAFGHLLGIHAPGLRRPWAYFKVIHHLLLAHGEALERIRSLVPDARVGAALSHTPLSPRRPGTRDEAAALLADQFMNRITLDPLLKGHYPPELSWRARAFMPRLRSGEMEKISAPCDFVGLNYYSREKAHWNPLVPVLNFGVTGKDGGRGEGVRDGVPTTAMGWEVWPRGLRDLLMRLKEEYGNPRVLITENGAAFEDKVEEGPRGPRVRDEKRTAFLRDYLTELREARRAGADVGGYFVWSLLDNFEWAEGYRPRFGLIRVDYPTQKRLIKDSGRWYGRLIKARRIPG